MGEVVRHLQAVLPADAILTNGAGNFADLDQQALRLHRRPAPARAAVGRDGLRRARGDRGEDRLPRAGWWSAIAGDGDFQMTGPGARLRAAGRRLADRPDRQQPQLRHHPHAPGAASIPAGSASPTSSTRTSWRSPRLRHPCRAGGRATADFPAAFERALASRTGAVLELVIDTESLTPRADAERDPRGGAAMARA